MDNTYVHPMKGPAGTDEIAIELYSKHKLTEDIKAELSHHFTSKLPKASNNKMLLIGSKVGITARLMEPYCSQIDIVTQQQYIPILQALFIKGQSVEYVFNRQGFIGEKHLVPVKKNPQCKINIIEISTFKNYVPRDSHYDIILLQNVIVHPKINILKQLMRLRHDVLITMIVPGKLIHKNLFELLSGIQQNILHVFYDQATHERTQYLRQITGRRQQIDIWEVFVWVKKNTGDVRKQLAKVETILQGQVSKNTVYQNITLSSIKGPISYESEASLAQYMDMHYGETQYFGVKNFPTQCAKKTIEAAQAQGIKGRALDVGCAVGRSTIQLAEYFDEAVGIQYSQQFVKSAKKILNQKYNQLQSKVHFHKGDACKLDQSLGKFDAIFAGNLIDRLYEPEAFIRSIVTFMKEKSILVLTSPYSWLQQYTKVQNWLGGKQINGKDVTTYERLQQLFGELGLKQLKAPEDVRFVIQENPWVYQYTAAHMTFWIKNK